jgi:hypothetical protein
MEKLLTVQEVPDRLATIRRMILERRIATVRSSVGASAYRNQKSIELSKQATHRELT